MLGKNSELNKVVAGHFSTQLASAILKFMCAHFGMMHNRCSTAEKHPRKWRTPVDAEFLDLSTVSAPLKTALE